MAHCILNGYFGTVDKGTPNERLTTIELNDKKLDQGNNIHNDMAFLKQDQVNTLMRRISQAFPYQPYNYMDILKKERTITGVFVMVNLWQFGLVSVIYRDNLSTWYCYEIEVPEMFPSALELTKDYDKLLRNKPLLATLKEFFKKTNIDTAKTELNAWFNPNSLAPDHSQTFHNKLKDMEEGTSFVENMRRLNRPAVGDTLAAS